MAHEISVRANGFAEMAFVGETPWHGLGQAVTKGASIGVWAQQAGMDWTAQQAEVRFTDIGGTTRSVASHKVLFRSDNQHVLGVVGQGYNVVQPLDILEMWRHEVEHEGWYISTAGVLREGRKLWVLVTRDETGAVNPAAGAVKNKDLLKRFVMVATSLDGSMKTLAKPTNVRVVCANTMSAALRDGAKGITVSHREMFDAAQIKRALGLEQQTFERFLRQAQEMADTPIKLDEALDVLHRVFGEPKATPAPRQALDLSWMGDLSKLTDDVEAEDQEGEPRESRSVARVLELFDGAGAGADLRTAKGTRWGLFNAVTQHVDHEVGRTPDTRLDSAWFGRGDAMKQRALEALTAEEA